MRVADEQREVNCLAIDTAGPFVPGWELIGPGKPLKMKWALIGAYRYRPETDLGPEVPPNPENVPAISIDAPDVKPAPRSRARPKKRPSTPVDEGPNLIDKIENAQDDRLNDQGEVTPDELEQFFEEIGIGSEPVSEGEGSEYAIPVPGALSAIALQPLIDEYLETGPIEIDRKHKWNPVIKASDSEPDADPEKETVKGILEQIKIEETRGLAKTTAVWPMAVAMSNKNQAMDGLSQFVDRIRRSGRKVFRVHSDQAREYMALPVRRWLRTQHIWQTYTAGDDPQANGLAEAALGVFKTKVQTNLAASKLEHKHWPYALRYVDHQYLRRHSDILKPDVCDKFLLGQKLIVKNRKWKKQQSSFLPNTEEVVWLGRNERDRMRLTLYDPSCRLQSRCKTGRCT